MKKIKRSLALALFSVLAACLPASAAGEYGTGHAFIGAQLSSSGRWSAGPWSLGALGGYHYFLPSSAQFLGMRGGIRGYLGATFAPNGGSYWRGGADYTLDFNPLSRYVFGVFAGLVVDKGFNYSFGLSGNFGLSLELAATHRFELLAQYGWSDLIGLRYIFRF